MTIKPFFYLLITILVWGSSFPAMSYLLRYLNPMELALGRFLLPGILGLLYFLKTKLNISMRDYFRFFLSGFFGIFLYNFFLNTGQTSVSAGASSFIVNCNPLFAFLIGFYLLKQKIKAYYWVGIIICIVGVFIISLERQLDTILNKGAFLILFAFLISNCVAAEIKDIKNLVINKELKKYDGLTFLDDQSNEIQLDQFEGSLVLLNFWATWCAPCKEEMPSLDQLQSQKNLNNLKIFPINVGQDNLEKAFKFFEDLGIDNLKIYFDSPITLAKKFGLRGVPTTILINKDGYEFARIVGSIDFKEKNFVEWLASYN